MTTAEPADLADATANGEVIRVKLTYDTLFARRYPDSSGLDVMQFGTGGRFIQRKRMDRGALRRRLSVMADDPDVRRGRRDLWPNGSDRLPADGRGG